MKFSFLFILLSVCSMRTFAQSRPEGKTFRAQISNSCHKMVGGGCTILTFCSISFDKDSALVSYYVEAYCTDTTLEESYEENGKQKGKMYAWHLEKDTVTIKGFTDYDRLQLVENRLYGYINKNGNKELLSFVMTEQK
jgi:hypothetical protein